MVDKPLTITAGSGIALAMSAAGAIPTLFAQALGIGLSSGVVAWDVYNEWANQQRSLEKNELFFYYRTGKLLAEEAVR